MPKYSCSITKSTFVFSNETGELLSIKTAIKNTGTGRFDNRALETGSHLNWTVCVRPD